MSSVHGIEVVECQHCGDRITVLPHRQPVKCVERDHDGQRSFLMIDALDRLLHLCIIGGREPTP